jgi:hypothetical protein
MQKIVLGLLAVLVVGSLAYLILMPPCLATDTVDHTFVIDREYREVIRTLVRQDSLESIVAMSDGRILDKQWESLVFDLDRIMRPVWRVNGRARFVIEASYPGYGKVVLELLQEVHVNQDFMDVSMTLIRPSDGVEVYNNYMHIQAEGSQTRFTLKNQIAVRHRIPINYHDYMKQQVHDANVAGAKNAEICIRKSCQKTGLISIPIK